MKIEMIGIDYQKASVGERERFALTASKSAALGAEMVKRHGASGCVVLSTCNRTELWCSGLGRRELQDAWRRETGCTPAELERFFAARSGMDAVRYLLELGCALHSQILGEDQILTQIKGAAQAAREGGSLDPVLGTLFRVAATAGEREIGCPPDGKGSLGAAKCGSGRPAPCRNAAGEALPRDRKR